MPDSINNMGLLGVSYFSELTPHFYAGVSGYGSVTGTQGGLFVLGFGGGWHEEIFPHWWTDANLFAGGGGGRSSLVGGGLMIRPQVGIAYSWHSMRFGLHYSYIDFPTGEIQSSQVGLDLDLPCDFTYVPYGFQDNLLFNNLTIERNDFGVILQAYVQQKGTKNVNGDIQDSTIDLVGAELDHYFTDHVFGFIKAAGAYAGNPNGYMDILGGFGLHWPLSQNGFAVVPQLGVGAGGGGNVDTGGGLLIQPQLGVEVPLSSQFAGRLSGGYLVAPKGNLRAATLTGELIYHLDFATKPPHLMDGIPTLFRIQNWRFQFLNQTYLHPQRTSSSITSAINLVVFQIDQLITPHVFFVYQAASAYSGNHSGGYATGMVGPGLQTSEFLNHHAQLFTEILAGAGGGGGLAIGGGGIVEPVVGAHLILTDGVGLTASFSQLKGINHPLNTPVVNLGLTIRFGMLAPHH